VEGSCPGLFWKFLSPRIFQDEMNEVKETLIGRVILKSRFATKISRARRSSSDH
jgi:hypothetical protein